MSKEEGDDEGDIFAVTVSPDSGPDRLDRFLADHCEDLSRSRLKDIIIAGGVRVDGAVCDDPSLKIKPGSVIHVAVPEPEDATPQPENIPLDIIYEDDDLLVINKQAGLVVHPGAGNWTGTLVNALLYHCGDSLSGIGGVRRPGIVHRLDKDTTGVMIAAKNDAAHRGLSEQLSDRSLSRHYRALIWGVPVQRKGTVDQPIGRHPAQRQKMTVNHKNGRDAVTHYHVQDSFHDTVSMVECRLESGRTHQIRVHMAHIKHPLLGDPAYGAQSNAAASMMRKAGYDEACAAAVLAFPRQALHAFSLRFIHPLSGEERHFEAPLAADMAELVIQLKM